MTCPGCQAQLLEDAVFCSICGITIRRRTALPAYAGFWRRVLAIALDLILMLPLIEWAKEWLFLGVFRWDPRMMAALNGAGPALGPSQSEYLMLSQIAAFETAVFFILLPYYVWLEASPLKGTLGKRILGLRVTDLNGARIGVGRAFARYFARLLSAMPMQMGFVIAGFTPRKQALHDYIARTQVVKGERDRSCEFCRQCGSEVEVGADACRVCGTRIPQFYAGLGKRMLALALDSIVLFPVFLISGALVLPSLGELIRTGNALQGGALTGDSRDSLMVSLMIMTVALWGPVVLAAGVYQTAMEGSRFQATLGKLAVGIRVADRDGGRIGFGQSARRAVARILSLGTWCSGYFMAFFDARKRTLHDALAGTVVVNRAALAYAPRMSSVAEVPATTSPSGEDDSWCMECGTFLGRLPVLYGGFWRRAAALYIDLMVTIPVLVILNFLVVIVPHWREMGATVGAVINPTSPGALPLWLYEEWALMFLGWGIYYTAFESSTWQATPGKRAMGLKVTDLEGRPLTFGRAAGRFAARILSFLPCLLGFLVTPLTIRKQTFHDMAAGTLVVETQQPARSGETVARLAASVGAPPIA